MQRFISDDEMARPLNKNGRFSVGAIKADLGRASRPMDATYQKRRARHLRALKWLLIASFVFGGVAIATASALAQVYPFADPWPSTGSGKTNARTFGDSDEAPNEKVGISWIPAVSGVACAYELYMSKSDGFVGDATVKLVDMYTTGEDPDSTDGTVLKTWYIDEEDIEGVFPTSTAVWLHNDPEQCQFIEAGDGYAFLFERVGIITTGNMYVWGGGTAGIDFVSKELPWAGSWSNLGFDFYLNITGTQNTSTVAWYASSTVQYPEGFNIESDACADWGPFTIVCRMLQWLFIPSDDAISEYEAYKTLITTKAPLGYFDATQDAFFSMMGASSTEYESVTITSSSLQTLYITASSSVMPFLDAGSTTIRMWDVEETKNSVLMQRVLPYLFTFERWGMWLGLCWYLYIRIRDMYL